MWENELLGKLKQIRRRMRMLSFYNSFLRGAFWAAVAALVFAGVSRLVQTGPVTLWHVLGALGGMCLAVTALWALLRPLNLFQTAVHADVHLGLRERLSTAYVFMRDQREIVEEVRRDALEASRSIQPRRDFRPNLRPHTKYFWLPLLFAALMWQFVPQYDLFASRAADTNTLTPQTAQADPVVKELEKIQKKLEQAPIEKKNTTEQLDELKDDIDKLVQEMAQQPVTKPQEAMAKISTMQERLEEQRKPLQEKLDATQMTKPLSKTGDAREIAEAMKKGDMQAAQKAVQEMMEKLQKGELSQQEMERLAQQLDQLAQEMQDSGEMSEKMKELSKQLSEACKNCEGGQLSSEDLKSLGQSASKLSQEMLSMQEAMDQLKKMSEMQKKLGECKSACKGGGQLDESALGQGAGSNRDKIGPGMGGEGIGQGNPAAFSEEDVAFQDDKVEGVKNEGEIISSMKVPQMGEGAMPGASVVEAKSITADYRRDVETSMDNEAIPASHREVVRRYFDNLNPGSAGSGDAAMTPQDNSGSVEIK